MRFLSVAGTIAAWAALGCKPEVYAPPGPVPSVTARFDPTAMPPVVPTPNDLALLGGDGVHPVINDLPTDSPAQRALNAYLRARAGFPPSSPAVATFTGPLDPSSIKVQTSAAAGSIVVIDATAGALISGVTATTSADGTTLTLTATNRWPSGHKVAVLLYGEDDPAGLRGAGGKTVLASPTFFIARSPGPLLARCGDPTNAACICPAAAIANPNDTTCHSVVRGLSDAQARQAEPLRAQLGALLAGVAPLTSPHDREAVVLAWAFTITPEPIAEFDPVGGTIPFPNDVLISPTTGLVTLPIPAGSPMAPLFQELNTLDGFSTSAAITAPIDAPTGVTVDAASLTPNGTLFLANLDPSPTAEQPPFAAAPAPGQIVIQPQIALVPDQRRYVVVLSRLITAGGMPLVPAPTTFLLLQPNPLFDGTHSTVSSLDDSQAQQLEGLRQALAPLVAEVQARGLPPEQVAALWTFTTQSIQRPLAALDAWPTRTTLTTDVTATAYTDFSMLPDAVKPLVADVKTVVLGSFTTRLAYDPATRVVGFSRSPSPTAPTVPAADVFAVVAPATAVDVTVRFWLTLPSSPGANVPVVIVQHGLGSWRGDVFSLGEDLAKGGRAAIGFDLDFHGSRTKCSKDSQCMGTCNVATGVCSGGFIPRSDPTACILAAFSKDLVNDCAPAASGNGYIDPANLFSGRAGGYQYVVDAAQLVRVLEASGAGSLAATAGANALDTAKLSFLGQSLGAIDGTVFLATDPSVTGASVLNVAGGHLFELLADGAFHDTVDQVLMQLGIMRGTPAYFQLVQTARWALDPVDPFSVARFVVRAPSFSYVRGTANAAKLAVVQEAGMDQTIPPIYEADLSGELWFPNGLDAAGHAQGREAGGTFVSTYFPDAVHSTLLTVMPTAAVRTQAVTYVLSDGATLPTP